MKVPLLSLEEAQERLLALTAPLPVEHVDVQGSIGRFLASPLLASRTQPSADLSAMDGYAVSEDDFAGPWRVVGESAAGHPYKGSFGAGETIRVSTGAVLPAGTAAVILQEDVDSADSHVTLKGELPHPVHKHIRPCGMDFMDGAEILPTGACINAAQAALAIAAGHKHLPLRRIPRLLVIDSGDELAADPDCCLPHQIPASNGTMLLVMARSIPVDASYFGPVPDTIQSLIAAFEAGSEADVIVTSGGASVGDHDLVRPALELWGASLDFWRVAIKPGKPILVATRPVGRRKQIILGLPGNPVSSFVTAYHFLLPLLRQMLGSNTPLPMAIRTRLAAPVRANGPRREFLRGRWDGEKVVPHSIQDSGALAALAASNVLIDRPGGSPEGDIGDLVRIFPL